MPEPGSFHHVTLSVTNLIRSAEWYARALGLARVAEREGDGWIRALMRAPSGLMVGLTEHTATNPGDRFDHTRVGIDHVSLACRDRAEVDAWAAHLDTVGVAHDAIVDAAAGHVLVCRDPDGIPIEFFAPR
jgi:glyoxylase I family protein